MIYSFDLSKKVILITGGYGYLGKAITESLVFHNAKVYVLGRSEDQFLKEFKDHKELRNRLFFENCNVEDSVSIVGAFQRISEREGQINCLINNAFYTKGNDPFSLSDDDWAYGIDGTLSSMYRCIREIIPYLENNESSRIINVASIYGLIAPDFSIYDNFPNYLNPPHYGAAKAGVIQLTKYYASLLGEKKINVNSVTPGPFPNDKVQTYKEFISNLKKKTCLNRIGKPEDLAGIFVYLSSEASNFMTGENIVIDGGWSTK